MKTEKVASAFVSPPVVGLGRRDVGLALHVAAGSSLAGHRLASLADKHVVAARQRYS